ncbi:MAG: nickel pincer cofactor biosynthesis protein LarC [Cyanobacteriota bacterium]|nr:nickel pincer cofactor biosynthesis protein LarC [Cyanobacteriota bacterium]
MGTDWAYLDLPTGVAGDMLLAALLDLGVPEAVLLDPLRALGLGEAFRFSVEAARSGGLRGLRVNVLPLEALPPQRHWRQLQPLLQAAPWPDPLRQRVLAVFTALAEAEAAVHGCSPEAVHFHELGAVDALVDVVGVCAGLLHLGIDGLLAAPPPAGHGQVDTAHGRLPLPAPAVLELALRHGIPFADSGGFPPGELCTPTGLALLSVWVKEYRPLPALTPRAVGIGLGHRTLDRPNLLRLWLPEGADDGWPARVAPVLLQQCQIDDMDGEALAFLQDELRSAGALDVYLQPLQMKKGRPGVLVSCLVRPADAPRLRQVWWRHSTTLGLREQIHDRWELPRQSLELSSPWGPVRAKRHPGPAGPRVKVEADELARLAREHGLGWRELRDRLEPLPQEDDDGALA